MSLHLRDKILSLTSSSICWLPSFDHNLSLQVIPSMFADTRITARVHLAEIQEQLYRYLSVEPRQPPQQAASEMASICRNLDSWASSHETYTLPFSSSHEAELQLTYLATRMLAYSRSRGEAHRRAILDDARASCLILLVSYEKHDQSMLNMLQSLRRPLSSSTKRTFITEHQPVGSANSSPSTGSLTSLINAFPVMAFFQLTKHILWSQDSEEPSKTVEGARTDLDLLRDVYSCAVEVNSRTQSQNRASQVERTFGSILELIQLLRYGGPDLSPSYDVTDPSYQVRTPNTSSIGTGAGDLPVATMLPSTDMSWDFLTSPFEDTTMSFGSQPEVREERRKRPRTSDMDFSIDSDSLVSFLPTGWDSVLT